MPRPSRGHKRRSGPPNRCADRFPRRGSAPAIVWARSIPARDAKTIDTEIGLAQSTTSRHLRILKDAGIIIGEIERPRVCYSLNPSALRLRSRFLDGLPGAEGAS